MESNRKNKPCIYYVSNNLLEHNNNICNIG